MLCHLGISSIVYCYQHYRMEDSGHKRKNGPLPGHKKVESFCDVQPEAAYASDQPSPYPAPPGDPRKDQYVSDSDSETRSTAMTVCAQPFA